MKRVKPESLKALNQKLDIVRVLEEIGVADIADTHPEVLSSCPFHAGTDVEAVLTVDKKTRTAICDEASCAVASGEPLIDVYVRATRRSLLDAAEYWASIAGVTLDYEEEPVAAAEPASLGDEAMELEGGNGEGELHAEDLEALSADQAPDPFAEELAEGGAWAVPEELGADVNATVSDVRPIALHAGAGVDHAVVTPESPLTTVNFNVPSEAAAPISGVRPDRIADEEALLRYLLGADAGALHDVVAIGITDHDFRGGGSGPPGLAVHGAIFSAVRKLRERHREIDRESLLAFVPPEHQQKMLEVVAQIQRGTATDRKRFRQALRRLSEIILRENLESALRASITDILARPDTDARTLLAHAQERLAAVGRSASAPLVTQEMAMQEVMQSIFDVELVPVPTFSDGLNKLLNGGLQFGSFSVIAGPAGAGKTALLVQIADGVAAANNERVKNGQQPVPVLYVSTCASRRELALRSLSRLSRINGGALLSRRWITGWEGDLEGESDIDESSESVAAYYERRVKEAEGVYRAAEPYLAIVEASPLISVEAIRSYVLQALRRFGSRTALVIVDSLQHVGTGDGDSDRAAGRDEALLEAVGARLRHMAISMGLPLLAALDVDDADVDSHGRGSMRAPLESVSDLVLGLSVDEDILDAGHVKHPPSALSKRQNGLKEMLERLRERNPLEFSHSEYAVLEPLKHRTGPRSPVVFVFHKAWSAFEELEL